MIKGRHISAKQKIGSGSFEQNIRVPGVSMSSLDVVLCGGRSRPKFARPNPKAPMERATESCFGRRFAHN